MIEPPERLPERDRAIIAMLPHAAFDGWTMRALRAGLADAGMPGDEAELLFPAGAVDMIETFCDLADRRMEAAASALPPMGLSRRIRAVIALRLEQNRPHKDAIRRAIAILALPRNARPAAAVSARTVDCIWHAAGDRSADFAWYTKRLELMAIYTATILYWLRDTSTEDVATLAFLDRRLAMVARVSRMRARLATMAGRLPHLPAPRPKEL